MNGPEQESSGWTHRAGEAIKGLGHKLSQGEAGPLLVILMVAVIWTFFYLQNPRFLSPANLTNLMLQQAAIATISMGVVLVLLLGEIDLSVGAVSGFTASVMAVLIVKSAVPPILAALVAVLLGTLIGLFNGFMITRFRIPSFVVTLAASLTLLGLQLLVLGGTGTVNLFDSFVTRLTSTFFPPMIGWPFAFAVIAMTFWLLFRARARRKKAGLRVRPIGGLVLTVTAIGAALLALVFVVNEDRGLPLVVCIVLGLALGFAYLTEHTRLGRHIFAIGGNSEAARRAGIRVNRTRVTGFALCSTMAAAGGVLAASRLLAVNQSSGGSDLLLMAIAGPVIAGTSLFGGQGSIWSALLGAIVIGSIANGMDLLAFESSVKYIVTGGVLIAAVTIEAITRLRRESEQGL